MPLLPSGRVALDIPVTPLASSAAEAVGQVRRRSWRHVVRRSAPVLLGLGAIGITQPLLDLYGRNGEVLAALGLSRVEMATWLLVVAAGVPVGVTLLEVVVDAIAPRWWPAVRRLTSLAMAVAILLVVLRYLGVDRTIVVATAALGGAVAVVIALERFALARSFASYLGVANLAFVGLFLAADGGALLRSGVVGVASIPPGTNQPVVLVIFDEFPLTLVVDEDGMINEERFPEMAALAERSSWFRNATSPSQFTTWAVPSLLTGQLVTDDQLPIPRDHPHSIYTLLGGRYSVRNYSVAVDICPDNVCVDSGAGGLRAALADAAVVWGHRGLPSSMRDRLPRIDQRLGGFTAAKGPEGADLEEVDSGAERARVWDSIPLDEREPEGQLAVFDGLIDEFDGESSLLVAHLALPHWPWRATPFGYSISTNHDHELWYVEEGLPGRDFVINQKYQRHMLQAGAADAALGRLVDTLETKGLWDDTLLIVTSDHGNSHLGPSYGRTRKADEATVEELLRVPLFIKAPGQRDGEVRDENARTTDIVPSIVDLLDLEVDWAFDGHSLFDSSPFPDVNVVVNAEVDRMSTDVEELFDLARRHAQWYTGDDSWEGLSAVGPLGPLVGQPLADLEVADASPPWRWRLEQAEELARLDLDSGWRPLVVTGLLWAEGDPDFSEYGLITVNGTVAGVAGGFLPVTEDGQPALRFSSLLIDRFVDGPNQVDLLLPRDGALDPGRASFVRIPIEG